MMRARLFAVAAAAGLCTLVATPASAQTASCVAVYPATTCEAVLASGATITLTIPPGTYLPGEQVTLTVFSEPIVLGTVTAANDGSLTTTVRLPAGLEPGSHRIEARGLTSGAVYTIQFQIAATGTGTDGGTGGTGGLVNTGSNATLPLAGLGASLVVLGAGAIVLARRTRVTPVAA